MDIRKAEVSRKTSETEIEICICLDGTGKCEADTGIGFFDHMLNSFARHGLFDLYVRVHGDLEVDSHHTIEDTGIVLGEAIKKALGDKKGINALVILFFRWTRRLFLHPWICPVGLISIFRFL